MGVLTMIVNKTFILAGKAIFTVSNDNDEHFTYRVNAKNDRYKEGVKVYFASLLTGPDNLSSYTYMGLINPEKLSLVPTKGSKIGSGSKSAKVLRWALRVIAGRTALPEGYDIQHAGRCCRCCKTLTEPESLATGMGPYCRQQLGVLH